MSGQQLHWFVGVSAPTHWTDTVVVVGGQHFPVVLEKLLVNRSSRHFIRRMLLVERAFAPLRVARHKKVLAVAAEGASRLLHADGSGRLGHQEPLQLLRTEFWHAQREHCATTVFISVLLRHDVREKARAAVLDRVNVRKRRANTQQRRRYLVDDLHVLEHFLRAGAVRADQPARAQQRAAEDARHHDAHVDKLRAVQRREDRLARCAMWLAVVRADLAAVQRRVRVAVVTRRGELGSLRREQLLHLSLCGVIAIATGAAVAVVATQRPRGGDEARALALGDLVLHGAADRLPHSRHHAAM